MAQPFLDPNFYRRYRRYYTYVEPIIRDPLIRGYFELIASLILVTIFILFALSPTINTILSLIRKIDDQKKVLSAMDVKIKDLITAQDNYSKIEDKINLLDEALPKKPAPETVIDEVVKTASSSGVNLSGLQFRDLVLSQDSPIDISAQTTNQQSQTQPSVQNVGIPIVPFSLSVDGSGTSVQSFLRRLENLPREIRISSLSLAVPAGQSLTSSAGKLSAAISNVAYYLK